MFDQTLTDTWIPYLTYCLIWIQYVLHCVLCIDVRIHGYSQEPAFTEHSIICPGISTSGRGYGNTPRGRDNIYRPGRGGGSLRVYFAMYWGVRYPPPRWCRAEVCVCLYRAVSLYVPVWVLACTCIGTGVRVCVF